MLQSYQKILIQFLMLAAGLMLQPFALFNRIVLLRVSRGNLLAIDAALENFDRGRIIRRKFSKRNELLGCVGDERRVDEGGLYEFFKYRLRHLEIHIFPFSSPFFSVIVVPALLQSHRNQFRSHPDFAPTKRNQR